MKAKYHFIAAIVAGVLFVCGFALASGIDQNAMQAIPACMMVAASAAVILYVSGRTGSSEQTIQARKARKRAKAA